MSADSAATEGWKIDGWAESKNFPLQSVLGFPLVGTSHESQRDIYSVDSRVSKFPPANTATSNNSGLPLTNDALFSLPDGRRRDWDKRDEYKTSDDLWSKKKLK